MTEWMGAAAPGHRPRPEDDATRQARHDMLATLLGAYADGELPPETMAQVEAHLLGCDRCRREVVVQQGLGDRLATLQAPALDESLLARVRASTAELPPTPVVADTSAFVKPWTRRLTMLVSAVLVLAAAVWGWQRSQTTASTLMGRMPAVLAPAPGVLASVLTDYRQAVSRDLPGRARDLDAVRGALPFPITPLRRDDLRLVAAWTTELDGELAAVLAYRWQDRLVLQYALSDASLFRSRDIRQAFAAGQPIAMDRDGVGLLGWSEPQGGAILVGDVTWNTLRPLAPAGR